MVKDELGIGAVAERTGVAPSALRFYEEVGLLAPERNEGGHRRYHRSIIRRVSFIRVAQEVGLSLDEIRAALAELPVHEPPVDDDWTRISTSWRPRLQEQIDRLERLRDRLDGCIGCGCLSMKQCRLLNPDDVLAERGAGPHLVLEP